MRLRLSPLPLPRAALLALALLGSSVALADETDQARRLAELRAEVESLSAEIDAVKEDARGELRSIELQKTDLEARIRQEEVRVEELQRMIERQRTALQSEKIAGEVLSPVLDKALADLRSSIQGSLPYRHEDRLAEIDKIESQLVDGTLTPQRATTRVWQLVEDELRLTRENILDEQVVPLPDGEALVDVARVGMVMMYWRSDDGTVGAVTGGPGNWSYTPLDGASATQVEKLFDALEKQVRVGYFELPNVLVEGL